MASTIGTAGWSQTRRCNTCWTIIRAAVVYAFRSTCSRAAAILPKNLEEVSEREKDIRFSSRTRVNTDAFRQKHEVRHAINELHKLLPQEIARTEQAKRLYAFGCVTEMDIVQLIFRPYEPQGASKDYEFSRGTMNARWEQGISDASTTLRAAPWLAPKPRELRLRVFDVMHEAR